MGSYSGRGKGGGKHQHQKKKTPKKPPKQNAYAVTFKNSVPSDTDTDPDNRSDFITDITIRIPGKAGTMMMEVKVDPGVQPSCIPLHKFKTLFPHLCRDGLPKEGLLDNLE